MVLESVGDQNLSYRIYNVETGTDRWFNDYSQVIEFLYKIHPEADVGCYGSITPYAVGKKSSIFGISTQAFQSSDDSLHRWAFEGESLANILWCVNDDGTVSIWIEDVEDASEPLVKYIRRYGQKDSKVNMLIITPNEFGGGVDWGEKVIPLSTKISSRSDNPP